TTNQRCSVVQWCVREENVDEQLAGEHSVDGNAGLGIVLQPCFALEHQKGAVTMPGELTCRTYDFIDRFFGEELSPRCQRCAQPLPGMAELFERSPQLRLKNDWNRDDERRPGSCEQPVQRREVKDS